MVVADVVTKPAYLHPNPHELCRQRRVSSIIRIVWWSEGLGQLLRQPYCHRRKQRSLSEKAKLALVYLGVVVLVFIFLTFCTVHHLDTFIFDGDLLIIVEELMKAPLSMVRATTQRYGD